MCPRASPRRRRRCAELDPVGVNSDDSQAQAGPVERRLVGRQHEREGLAAVARLEEQIAHSEG